MCSQENFGRQEQHLEQHYNEVLQTLSQRYDQRAARLARDKKSRLEVLYGQLLGCGRTMDSSKELIEAAQGVYRSQDMRLFLKVRPNVRACLHGPPAKVRHPSSVKMRDAQNYVLIA